MLFIKGIYLLLSHLPTSHTTVRAVRHTAVSYFSIEYATRKSENGHIGSKELLETKNEARLNVH